MIIKKEERKEVEINERKNILKNLDKKKIIIIFVLITIIVGSIFLIKKSKEKVNITIDIVSQDIGYSYGPNSSTDSKLKVGQEIELKIITDSALFVKCYSSNEDVIEFDKKNIAIAKKKGSAQLYCEANKQKSNVINVLVGE